MSLIRGSAARRAIWAWVLVCLGCQATPPEDRDGSGPGPGAGPYPTLATCTPAPPCPGLSCATNAAGSPDGKLVDLLQCRTLQLTFTTGIVVTRVDQPHLAVHLGRSAGLTRVEASVDGVIFRVVGFIGGLQAGAPDKCRAPVTGTRALVYLDRCNTISDVSIVRLIRDTTVSDGPTVDAVEALSFKLSGKP